jgi:hypothetical protein
MDLRKEILKDHSKAQANKIIRWVGNSPERFDKLVQAFLDGPYRITQRAGWPLSYCVEFHPELVKPHLKSLVNAMSKKDQHASVKRNVVRLLQYIDIPKSYQGKIADQCFSFLSNPKEAIAVRVFSMTVLANLSKHHPELKQELILIMKDQLPYGSAAFISRSRKILKELSAN